MCKDCHKTIARVATGFVLREFDFTFSLFSIFCLL